MDSHNQISWSSKYSDIIENYEYQLTLGLVSGSCFRPVAGKRRPISTCCVLLRKSFDETVSQFE